MSLNSQVLEPEVAVFLNHHSKTGDSVDVQELTCLVLTGSSMLT